MKTTKKLLALALVLVLMMGLSITALAAVNNSITVTGGKEGETFNIYKMMDLSVDNEETPEAYRYTINSAWTGFFTGEGAGAAYVTVDATDGHVTWKEGKDTEAQMIAFAQAAAAYAAANSIAAAKDPITLDADGDAAFTGLDNGYYLVTSSLGTKAIVDTTPAKAAVSIAEKNATDSITKTVKEDSTSEYGAENDAQIGQLVEFKSEITLAGYTRNVKVIDEMDTGLTYTAGSVAIDGLTKGTEYTVTENASGFVIEFKDTYLETLTAETTKLNLTYTATLNENVIKASAMTIIPQVNKITITYGDKQSLVATTTTTTHKFEIKKHNSSNTVLADAVFQLKDEAGAVVNLLKVSDTEYRVATADELKDATVASHVGTDGKVATVATGSFVSDIVTVKTNNIVVYGVDSDKYTLTELLAPEGYNKLKDPVDVTVDAANSTVADVLNNAGTELPSTGGIGTTIFYILGTILVLGAAVVLVAKKRVHE